MKVEGIVTDNERIAIEAMFNNVIDNTLNNNNSESEVLQPTGISSAQETSLGISSIINIIFIAVGVIIILLAIAILIRLNG